MHMIINTSSMVPIYEQIMENIKKMIVSGELKAGDVLPSVRVLSKELRISALTVKKAYDCLEEDGFTSTVHGKGTYVTAANTELMAEQQRREIEKEFESAVQKGRSYGMSNEELRELLALILEDE
ncbi:MAG TPA: GntR family transcriptional regulator [Erysipelotrichaceae bacterium]|nr:GntR family transcriptional regulator [Erysipelotrichaceae bacterium]